MEKISRLTFIEDAGFIRYPKLTVRLVKCKCECGNTTILRKPKFLSNQTLSCGCLQKEMIGALRKTHGMTKTSEYSSWAAMITRCTNPNTIQYKNYGGRGIKVCTEWLNSFENFIKDMGLKPTNKHSIERVDNNKGYTKDNCVWATRLEQCSNKSNNCRLNYNGELLTVTEISRLTGIKRARISNWINRSKYPVEKVERLLNEIK